MRRLLPIILIAMALCWASCSDDSCRENGSSLPLATCHTGVQQGVNALSIMGIGVPGDSLLVDSTTVNETFLPLRAGATSTSYALWRPSADGLTSVRDTLTIDYTPVAFFHSVECGAMYNFDIHQVSHTRHGIDSVVLLTPLVTNTRTPSLRIYFTPLAP